MQGERTRCRGRSVALASCVFTALAASHAAADTRHEHASAGDEVPPVDTVEPRSGLREAASEIARCDCRGVVYLWSPAMPLSLTGIPEIAEAARSLGLALALVRSEELSDYGESGAEHDASPVAEAMLAAGALAHAPALLVHDRGYLLGPAVLGFKKADAYRVLIERRLADGAPRSAHVRSPAWELATAHEVAPVLVDHVAVGLPGAYFRFVPGRGTLAYESSQRVYLLDLEDGLSRLGPGYIDFVPTPDGRYFVTPGPRDGGLTFYDGAEVFEAARRERSAGVEPIFTDARMRDQYPSVGILEEEPGRTRYRVLTSWFEGIVYRDYDVFVDEATGVSSVRPVGQPVVPCEGSSLSTPIMSQTGLEVAARDEATGTTKIFSIMDRGRCEEVLDLGVATSKVAWHASGQKLAFRLPRLRSVREGIVGGEEGIFLYDRRRRTLTGLPGSQAASSLAFPEFVRDDAIAFMIPGRTRRDASVFRIVEGIR